MCHHQTGDHCKCRKKTLTRWKCRHQDDTCRDEKIINTVNVGHDLIINLGTLSNDPRNFITQYGDYLRSRLGFITTILIPTPMTGGMITLTFDIPDGIVLINRSLFAVILNLPGLVITLQPNYALFFQPGPILSGPYPLT